MVKICYTLRVVELQRAVAGTAERNDNRFGARRPRWRRYTLDATRGECEQAVLSGIEHEDIIRSVRGEGEVRGCIELELIVEKSIAGVRITGRLNFLRIRLVNDAVGCNDGEDGEGGETERLAERRRLCDDEVFVVGKEVSLRRVHVRDNVGGIDGAPQVGLRRIQRYNRLRVNTFSVELEDGIMRKYNRCKGVYRPAPGNVQIIIGQNGDTSKSYFLVGVERIRAVEFSGVVVERVPYDVFDPGITCAQTTIMKNNRQVPGPTI